MGVYVLSCRWAGEEEPTGLVMFGRETLTVKRLPICGVRFELG